MFINTIYFSGEKKVCLSNCIDQLMSVSSTQASYPSKYGFTKTNEFCYVLKKIISSCKNDRRVSLEEHFPGICLSILSVDNSLLTCPLDFEKTNITSTIIRFVVNYAKENIAKVNIFLKEPFVKRYNREEKITTNTFIGTIGGLLGLFTGFSFISVAEIVYLLGSTTIGILHRAMEKKNLKQLSVDSKY